MAAAPLPQAPAAPTAPAPRVTELGMLSIALVAAGVIDLAAYLPRRAPLGPPVGLLIAAAAVFAVNVFLLSRQRNFAWWRFGQIGRWMLLVYTVIAGMLEYTFIYDHTRGTVLVIMSLLLVLFTVNVPLIAAFTVARYQEPAA